MVPSKKVINNSNCSIKGKGYLHAVLACHIFSDVGEIFFRWRVNIRLVCMCVTQHDKKGKWVWDNYEM